jgi:Leucine-rich repeat (LRR) protein
MNGYNSQIEFIVGAHLKFDRGVEVGFRYSIPYSTMEYSNIGINLNLILNYFRLPERKVKYKNLDDALKSPDQCKYLVIHYEKIDSLSSDICKLTNLVELVLDGNNLKELTKEIGTLKHLTKLSLKYNNLESLPKEIGNLTELQELNLHHNSLKILPDEIGNLINLEYLYIGKNQLTKIPESIGNCSDLIELNVINSGILLEMPSSISQLRKLEFLYIDSNTRMPIPFHPPNSRLKVIIQ